MVRAAVQRRQARVWESRPRQCSLLIRTSQPILREGSGRHAPASLFDNGVLCSSPNSVVVDETVEPEVRRQFQGQGGDIFSRAGRSGCARQGADLHLSGFPIPRWSENPRPILQRRSVSECLKARERCSSS